MEIVISNPKMLWYILISVILISGIVANFFSKYSGGMWGSGKKRFDLDGAGWVLVVIEVLFTFAYLIFK